MSEQHSPFDNKHTNLQSNPIQYPASNPRSPIPSACSRSRLENNESHFFFCNRVQKWRDPFEEQIQQCREVHYDRPSQSLHIVILNNTQELAPIRDRRTIPNRRPMIVHKTHHRLLSWRHQVDRPFSNRRSKTNRTVNATNTHIWNTRCLICLGLSFVFSNPGRRYITGLPSLSNPFKMIFPVNASSFTSSGGIRSGLYSRRCQ